MCRQPLSKEDLHAPLQPKTEEEKAAEEERKKEQRLGPGQVLMASKLNLLVGFILTV